MKRTLLLSVLLAGCQREPEWQGWVYPKSDDETLSISLAGFKTFEQCQQAAIDQIRRLPEPDKAGYECGRSCRWDESWRANVCKETRR
jgi:hypothetical protein